MRSAFIQEYQGAHAVRPLRDPLNVHPSGYYVWLQKLKSKRQRGDDRNSGLIKQFWLESGCVYCYRKIHRDLRDLGERCGVNRVHRLKRLAGLQAQVGYRAPVPRGGHQHIVTLNILDRHFDPMKPNQAWVTDITYIKTHEGWLYLGTVLDLFSR